MGARSLAEKGASVRDQKQVSDNTDAVRDLKSNCTPTKRG